MDKNITLWNCGGDNLRIKKKKKSTTKTSMYRKYKLEDVVECLLKKGWTLDPPSSDRYYTYLRSPSYSDPSSDDALSNDEYKNLGYAATDFVDHEVRVVYTLKYGEVGVSKKAYREYEKYKMYKLENLGGLGALCFKCILNEPINETTKSFFRTMNSISHQINEIKYRGQQLSMVYNWYKEGNCFCEEGKKRNKDYVKPIKRQKDDLTTKLSRWKGRYCGFINCVILWIIDLKVYEEIKNDREKNYKHDYGCSMGYRYNETKNTFERFGDCDCNNSIKRREKFTKMFNDTIKSIVLRNAIITTKTTTTTTTTTTKERRKIGEGQFKWVLHMILKVPKRKFKRG